MPASVVFGAGETEASFVFYAVDDEVDDDESVALSFGEFAGEVSAGRVVEAAVSIADDELWAGSVTVAKDDYPHRGVFGWSAYGDFGAVDPRARPHRRPPTTGCGCCYEGAAGQALADPALLGPRRDAIDPERTLNAAGVA